MPNTAARCLASLMPMMLRAAAAAIERTEDFLFNQMGLPSKLHEVGIEDEENFAAMAKKAAAGCVGSFVPLEESDIVEIYRAAL